MATEAAPPVFLRKATGLVKGWSKFDAFVYSFLSVNLITLGFFGALSFAPYIHSVPVLKYRRCCQSRSRSCQRRSARAAIFV